MADNKSPTTNLEDTNLIAFMLLKGHKIREWQNTEEPTTKTGQNIFLATILVRPLAEEMPYCCPRRL